MNFPVIAMIIAVCTFVITPYILAALKYIYIPLSEYTVIVVGLLGVMILLYAFLQGLSTS